jgi:CheY-like chemotaxis protein
MLAKKLGLGLHVVHILCRLPLILLNLLKNAINFIGRGASTFANRREQGQRDLASSRSGAAMTARILVIEDNAENRYLVTFLLQQRGHEIVTAESGALGLELAAQLRPDLILLDIQLPGMDGHAVARALKSTPELRIIPIIAVTSYAMVGDREKCLEAGAEGYIEKPINPETFVAEIERFLTPAGKATP